MNDRVVLDTSLVTKWVLNESDSNVALALLQMWKDNQTGLLAPDLLVYEISNVLYQDMRRRRIPVDQVKKALEETLSLDIVFISSKNLALASRAVELAQTYSLPASYDAYYLALAEREMCELWTADTRLWRAVQGKIDWVRNLQEYQVPSDGEK